MQKRLKSCFVITCRAQALAIKEAKHPQKPISIAAIFFGSGFPAATNPRPNNRGWKAAPTEQPA
jgi:hypothetical protein